MLRRVRFCIGLLCLVLFVFSGALATENRNGKTDTAQFKTLPESRGGQDMVGKRMPKPKFDRWLDTDESKRAFIGEGTVTLYRWWTNTCPYCEASLPAIESLRKKYEARGLRTVAVYHPKPPGPVSLEAVSEKAADFGYHGVIATDDNWSILWDLYLSSRNRGATSVTFLVDAEDLIRFVHPGPVLFPSDDPRNNRENNDFVLLDRAIDSLLKESQEIPRE